MTIPIYGQMLPKQFGGRADTHETRRRGAGIMNKEEMINTIKHLLDNGCSPIMHCLECPLNGSIDQSKVVLCAVLSGIREGK